MSENLNTELIYEILKKIQYDLSVVKREVSDTKLRLGAVEDHMSSLVVNVTGINHRLDRYDARFERVETRLGLIDA